jgi:hypothetical protein
MSGNRHDISLAEPNARARAQRNRGDLPERSGEKNRDRNRGKRGAVPKYRNASTNRTKLTPTPRKPTRAAAPTVPEDGNAEPLSNARLTLTLPATSPLIIVVTTGSADDSLRVRVLSIPQAIQAAAIGTCIEVHSLAVPRQHHRADDYGNRAKQQTSVHILLAGSTGRRNTGVKSLCWGFKLQGLTWSFVELTSHFVQIG